MLDIGARPGTAAIAAALRDAEPTLRCVRAPDPRDQIGVIVCDEDATVLAEALRAAAGAQVIVVTEAPGVAEPWRLLALGACDVAVWDGDPRLVTEKLRRLAAVDRIVDSPAVAGVLKGRSPALREALRDLVTAACFGTGPILITGETGTGKELAARVVHAVSPAARTGHLVVVDCTTIVPGLAGSELFGHERGAFTGAVGVRTGACAAADGGTLMLDEVGELPLELQPELLRVVQEGTYKRVGADTWQRARFRLVCATNRVLEDEVAAGRFRADLYYRIAAYQIRLPPLRDRSADVIPLFEEFLLEALGGPVTVGPAVRSALRARSFPGNLRDLRQLACRVAARHVGPGPVTPGDLPPEDRPPVTLDGPPPGEPAESAGALAESVREHLRAGHTLKQLREHVADLAVAAALEESGGNVRAAAARLGVTDRALHLRRQQSRERP